MSNYHAKPALLVFLSLVSLFLFASLPGKVHGVTGPPIVGVFSNFYFSSNITDPTLAVGDKFQVQVNVTNAPAFNGYEFVLYYDQNYINVSSYDAKTGTVFQNPYPDPGTYNGTGALRVGIVNLSSTAQPGGFFTGGSGLLANVNFQVLKAGGVSPLVLAAGMANPSPDAAPPGGLCPVCPNGAPNWTRLIASGRLNGVQVSYGIGVDTANGYFKNVAGKSGPVGSFTFSPTTPFQGNKATFNATASFDSDNLVPPYNGILEYHWDFGDRSIDANTTLSSPITTHAFVAGGNLFTGNFSVRLTVIDQDNRFQGMAIMLVSVVPAPNHCVAVDAIFVNTVHVQAGDNVPVIVRVVDMGTYAESFNLTITYGPPNATLAVLKGQTINPNHTMQYPETVPTKSLLSGIFSVYALVQLQSAKNCNQGSNLTQFSVDPPSSASAVLLIVAGIIVFAVVVVAIGVFRGRRRRREPPL